MELKTLRPDPAVQLAWVDEFIRNVAPYIFVREEDRVLIKRPNMAQKLNAKGAAVLKALVDGKSIREVLDAEGRDPQRVHDISLFLHEVRRFVEGTLDEGHLSHAVEVRPLDLNFSALPILSEVAVTYRCNLKCAFCYAGCNCTANPVGSDREMTTDEVRTVLDRIRRQAKVPSVSFTGGEATMRADLPELVAHARSLDLRVNLITNGTLVTPSLAGTLAASGLDSVQVSLEGTTAATHEKVTAACGSFARTVAAVGHFKAVSVHVHTHTTINRENLNECVAMPRFVRDELGLTKFSMNLVIPTGSAAINDRLVVRYSEIGPVLERILDESRRCGVEFMWYSPTPMCLFNPIPAGLGNKGCSACDALLSVAANGDVIPCASYDESLGNLLRQSATEIWDSDRARKFRAKFLAHPRCRACEDFAACNGACPLYWRHLGFGEIES